MTRWIAVMLVAVGFAAAARCAQDAMRDRAPSSSRSFRGATFFTEGKRRNEPSFNNYGLGGSVESISTATSALRVK